MRKLVKRMLALLMAVVLLCGCADTESFYQALQQAASAGDYVAYEDMEYVRPDMAELQQLLEDAIAASKEDNLTLIVDRIYEFYDAYDWFYTCYNLADIRYCGNLTDLYWEEENRFCAENSAEVDAALESLYYALAKSPCREKLEDEAYFGAGFFDSYDGENSWDAEFIALLEQEGQLRSRYYELSEIALDYEYGTEDYFEACGMEMVQLLVDLIGLRQEMAAYWGYDDYVEFAADFYYYRDYTPDQMEEYLNEIKAELVPLYRQAVVSERWDAGHEYSSEEETYDYVRQVAENMGGTVWEAFSLMDRANLYDISYGENKYGASFEVYLTSFWEPFVFMNPSMTEYDKLTFVHEFGHFCNDFASGGSYADVDVMEFFSQGMEYLSLCYGEDTEALAWIKLADGLCIYVEQAAFSAFEHRMYRLTGAELTAENLCALYEETVLEYGFDTLGYDSREFVTITHFYTNPMYISSYIVSNDAALQLYQMELTQSGAGLECLEENLDTECYYFLQFVEAAGLESPFEPGRVAKVRQTFEQMLS